MLARFYLAVVAVVGLSGCALPSTRPTVLPPNMNNFAGINEFAQSHDGALKTPLRILIIHGIGTDCPSLAEPLIAGLGDSFRLRQIPPRTPESAEYLPRNWPQNCRESTVALADGQELVRPLGTEIPIFQKTNIKNTGTFIPEDHEALLYTYRFSKSGMPPAELSISFLLWSPLTYQIKNQLSDLPQTLAPKSQTVASWGKSLLQENFSDAVLYAGEYRRLVMRPSVEFAICLLNGGSPSIDGTNCLPTVLPDGAAMALPSETRANSIVDRAAADDDNERSKSARQPVIVITHSLGSYMLTDALNDISNQEKNHLGNKAGAASFADHIRMIFMLANQLPLMNLTTIKQYPIADGAGLEVADLAGANPYRNLKQVVAFSDPNDILSYYVTPADFPDPGVTPINVYMGNGEWEVPGFYSSETGAHNNSFSNKVILRFIVCGMASGTIDKAGCPGQ